MHISLGAKLRRLLAALDNEVQAIYDEMEVPFRPRFYPIVQLLLAAQECGVSAIAERAGITQPAVTQTLNEMKRLGLVEAAPGSDRRSRQVKLSAKGRELAVELAPVWAAIHDAATSLDSELKIDLHETVDEALKALTRSSFGDRIRSQLKAS